MDTVSGRNLFSETLWMDLPGWAPTRRLKDVFLGLDCLFSDLIDFDDPLNQEAAQQYRLDKVSCYSTIASDSVNVFQSAFERKVKNYISRYC